MAYNRPYKARQAGRFNTPGQFVSSGELASAAAQLGSGIWYEPQYAVNTTSNLEQQYSQMPRHQQLNQLNLPSVQAEDVQMKPEPEESENAGGVVDTRPAWMKPKLAGVRKISKKEKRRRQNGHLRRLLTPKNAVMVLHEMLPDDAVANQFKVEPAPPSSYYQQAPVRSFCAELTLDGTSYKGYGENKVMARNAAAEQAIRDYILKKMDKVIASEGGGSEAGAGAGAGAGEEEEEQEALPMIQLASYALHKLFAEWEHEGHRVPQLRPSAAPAHPDADAEGAGAGQEAGGGGGAAGEGGARVRARGGSKKPKELPLNAARMHPCMLLTYLRPSLAYRELAAEGDRPQAMTYTLGIDVDGTTYIGKASNKKEARRAAAAAACQALYGVDFEPVATENAPQVPV